jgi:large subunit ribosomal protein L35
MANQKQKTRKSLVKRFRVTKNGKVMRTQGFKRHLNAKKTSKRKRRLSGMVVTDSVHAKKIKKALGK